MANTRRILYTQGIPADAQMRDKLNENRQVSKDNVVSEGVPQVENIGMQPGDVVLQGSFRQRFAGLMADELEELFASDAIQVVPFYGYDTDDTRVPTKRDGYYTLEALNSRLADPRMNATDGVHNWSGRLAKKGTRRTHWRAVRTKESNPDNDFGNTTTGYIAVPAPARKRRWFDAESLAREQPSLVETRATAHGAVLVFDESAASFDNPTLLYEIPYEHDGRADPKVWDDRGVSKYTSVGGTDVNQWRKVFGSGHEFEGLPRVENGRLRLVFDEAAGSLSASRWDEAVLGPADDLTNWSGFQTSLSVVSTPSRDGAAIETAKTNDSDSNSVATLSLPAPVSLQGETISFWYQTDNADTGTHQLALEDSSGTIEYQSFAGQVQEGTLVKVEVSASDYSTPDLSDIALLKWNTGVSSTPNSHTAVIDLVASGGQAWESRSLGPIHEPMDDLSDLSSGSNSSLSTVSLPSKDGTAVKAVTDDPSTTFSRLLSYDPTGTFDLSGGDVNFWYWTDDKSGQHVFRLDDDSGNTTTVDIKGEVTEGELVYVTVTEAELTAGSADLTSVDRASWAFGGNGSGLDKTIVVDRFAGPSPWEVYDLDLTRLGDDRVEGQVEFRDPSQSPAAFFSLNVSLQRGLDNAYWTVPNNQKNPSTTPSGLLDYLQPVAVGRAIDPQPEKGVVSRSEVQR